MNAEDRIPYNRALAYFLKDAWAIGERIFRPLIINRFAPKVAGIERNLRYIPGGHHLQSLDVITPLGDPPFPVLIFFHGGGNMFGDKGTYDRICKTFAAAGYLVFNANYRMTPRWQYPEQVQDAVAAANWVYKNASSRGGDTSRIFIAGDSAGAYFSSLYTEMALDKEFMQSVNIAECIPAEAIKALLLFYGVYNLATVGFTKFPFTKLLITGFLGQDRDLFNKRAEEGSPVNHVSPEFPPCYIASSEFDPLHSQAEEFVGALEEKGVRYEYFNLSLQEYPHTYHGYLNFWWFESARRTMREATEFLKKYT
jgi:acetyl esterase/lipase